jgi:hypothetical protein
VVLLPDRHRVPDALLGVQLPARVRESVLPLLHAAERSVQADPSHGQQPLYVLVMPLLALVSLCLLVGLSTAASP